MPVTAEFLADFSSFERGTKEAAASLDKLEGKTADFSNDFNQAFAGVDIQKLLTDPVGGASTAMEGLVESFSPFAKGAIAFASGAAAIGAAAYKLASWSADAAANLGDLSDKTGITVPSLSRLADAAVVAGTDIGKLSNVVYEMQKQMGEHPIEFAAALRDIGLEFQSFKELKPEDQLLAIAGALQQQVDPVERLQTGTDLLGKQYKEMAPALYDLADAMELTAGIDPITKEDADAAERFQMQIAALEVNFKAIARDIGAELVPAFNTLLEILRDKTWGLGGFGGVVSSTKKELGLLADAASFVTGNFTTMGPPIEGADKAMAGLVQSTKSQALALPELDAAMAANKRMAKEDAETLRDLEAAQKKAERAAQAHAAALERLNAQAMKQHWDAVGNILDEIFGRDKLQQATNWVDAIDALGGSVEQLRANELEKLKETMFEGINALSRSGELTSAQSSRFVELAHAADQALKALQPVVTVTDNLAKAQWDYVTALDEEARAQTKAAAAAKTAGEAKQAAQRPAGGGLLPNAIVGHGGVAYDQYGRPVVPGGAISGLPIVNVNINSPLGTPDAIARAVNDAMMHSYRSGGNRVPV